MTPPMRVFISPDYGDLPDPGSGGIRRVVEAQRRWLPEYDVIVVKDPDEADVLALHAGEWVKTKQPKPTVAHCHGLYWEGYDWARWALRLNGDVIRTIKQSDAVTGPSEWVSQAIRRGTWCKVETLYHGIDPEDWPQASHPSRQDDALKFVLWNKTRTDAICDPEPVDKLAQMAPAVQFITTFGSARDNVEVIGVEPYEQAKDRVHQASVYLCTSRETFGIGTLEAMAAGVPILGWAWGGQNEIVTHLVNGYLAKPGDYDDLLEGLNYCLEHTSRLGAAARRHVIENFTWQQRIRPYAELYERVLRRAVGPKVSVVIPYHNLSKYVTGTLKSVAGQTYKDWEAIVVDDASPEPLPQSAVDIIEADPRFVVVKNQTNQYLAGALNAGVTYATGKYIVPLDADNMLEPNALTTLTTVLDGDHELDIAYGKINFVKEDARGRILESFISDWPPEEASLEQQLAHRNQVPSTSMYRRRLWERVGGYRRRCHTAEDADFWTRCLSIGAVGKRATEAVTFLYRDRQTSMSHVNKDWAWHEWYKYSRDPELRLFSAGGKSIPAHEFPVVTVIIPVGPGHESYVLDALDSLQNQTFNQWEAIVVNDTDHPIPQLPSWARVSSEVVKGGKRGAATARNRGLALVRTPFVLFLDADDWLHSGALEYMLRAHQQHGGFIYSDFFEGETGEVKQVNDFDANAVLRQLPYPVTCLYTTEDLRNHNIRFDEKFNGKGWEDWDFALQVVAKAGICGTRVPAPLFHYRYTTGTLREAAYAAREDMKKEIWAKWEPYITGKEKAMPNCCGGGRYNPSTQGGQNPAPNTQAASNADAPSELVEYVADPSTGSRSFSGRVTGNRYRFDPAREDEKVRRVFTEDIPHLLSLGIFKRVHSTIEADAPTLTPLMAKGPPSPSTETPK